jgi:hypothetical protein
MCNRAVWIDHGEIRSIGSAIDVVREYDYAVHVQLNDGHGSIGVRLRRPPERASVGRATNPTGLSDGDGALEVVDLALPSAMSPTDSQPGSQTVLGSAAPDQPLERELPVFRRGPAFIESIAFLDSEGRDVRHVVRGSRLRIEVKYRVEGPPVSIGLAVGVNRRFGLESICQFSTSNPETDEEMSSYRAAPHRQTEGRSGTISAVLDPVQFSEGEYIFSVGILPNQPGVAEFYEYHHLAYTVTVLRDGHPLVGTVFYPMVTWEHSIDE